MLRRLIAVLACALVPAFGARGEVTPRADRFDRVDVAPTKTSIYVGRVALTMPTFTRAGGSYAAPYTAKVFPLFFYNEAGRLVVEISADQLQRLERGEAIEFHGRAVRDGGGERRVEGKATPADATGGKLKVRVFVAKRIELIFNTTYRFVPPP